MKILYLIAGFFVLFILIEIFLPKIIKGKKNRKNNPFKEMDYDFSQFFEYYFMDEWQKILEIQKDKPIEAQKLFDGLKKKLFEIYPEYYEQIDKKFLKNYFG